MPVVGLGGRSFPGVFCFSGGLEGRKCTLPRTMHVDRSFSQSTISFSPFLATYFPVTDFLFFVIVFGTLLFTHLEQLTPEIYVRVPLGFCLVLVYPRLSVLPGI